MFLISIKKSLLVPTFCKQLYYAFSITIYWFNQSISFYSASYKECSSLACVSASLTAAINHSFFETVLSLYWKKESGVEPLVG